MAYLQGLNMFTTWMRDDGLTWVIGRDQGIHIQLSHKQNQSQFFTRFPDVTIGPPLGVLKSVPILYAVIVKLCQLMIEKTLVWCKLYQA